MYDFKQIAVYKYLDIDKQVYVRTYEIFIDFGHTVRTCIHWKRDAPI